MGEGGIVGIGSTSANLTSKSSKGEDKEKVLKGFRTGCCCWNLENEDVKCLKTGMWRGKLWKVQW